MKREYGYAIETAIIKDEDILIKGVGARGNTKIPISLINANNKFKNERIIHLIDNEIQKCGFQE